MRVPATPPAAGNAAALQAGAFLSTNAALPEGTPSDLADARRYRHPALGDRVVVRFTPQPLAAADDVEMEVLGFGAPEVSAALARTRRRAPGFPAWALLHDPPRARQALAVVKEMRTLAKLARTKPGHAKEGFDEIAAGLARSVPHFLPSFFEEAGRAFLAAEAPKQAATMFARAREAERVHALPVEASSRDRAFLEFALAGAVTAKALSELAHDLAAEADPAQAYARFRELCVRRTLGGMPPWAGMAADLRRLAKGAGADAEAEDVRLIAELLDAPAVIHAAVGFWTSYARALARLAREKPATRGTLLRLFPEAPCPRGALVVKWLEILESCEALAGVIEPPERVSPEALPPDGAAAWLSLLVAYSQTWWFRAPDEVFGLIRRMAPRLRAEGRPVELACEWPGVDLDVLDLLLELRIPVADPPEDLRLRLDNWIVGQEGSKERPRDPLHVAADPRYRPHLDRAVGPAMKSITFDSLVRSMKGLAEARRRWILGQVAQLTEGTLPGAQAALAALRGAVSSSTFADLPEAWRALAETDFAHALARTLRGGILDELGWPALEAAADDLGADAEEGMEVFGAFPYLVLRRGLKAIALGPAGRLLEHDLRIGAGRLEGLAYAQGQIRVRVSAPGRLYAYWSGRPDDEFLLNEPVPWRMEGRAEIELPGGALLRGRRPLSAGDKTPAEPGLVWSDTSTYWFFADGAPREIDPTTGVLGRRSLPRFLEEFVAEGKRLEVEASSLHPLPAALCGRTPLGDRDGLAGIRVRTAADGRCEAEGVDGRAGSAVCDSGFHIAGLVRLPGHEVPRLLLLGSRAFRLTEPGGEILATRVLGEAPGAYAAGTPVVLPPPAWHLLSVRDDRGSRALRTVTVEAARALMVAVRADRVAGHGDGPGADRALTAHLPGVTDPRLRAGILGLAGLAEDLHAELQGRRAQWEPSEAIPDAEASLDAAVVSKVLRPIVTPSASSRDEGDLARELMEAGDHFRGMEAAPDAAKAKAVPFWRRVLRQAGSREPVSEEVRDSTPLTGLRWEDLIGAAGAVAFLATSPLVEGAHVRDALSAFLAAWAKTPFVEDGAFRRLEVALPEKSAYEPAKGGTGRFVARGQSRWFVRPRRSWYGSDETHPALEGAPSADAFALLPGVTLAAAATLSPDGWTRDRIEAFRRTLAERGPRPLEEPTIAELCRRTGLTRPEAALLWAGLPGIDEWTHDFLGKDGRAALGLKSAEAKVAQASLRSVPREVRREVFAAAAAGPVEALWTPLGSGPEDEASPVARAAAAWVRHQGRRVTIAQDLVVRAARELPRGVEPATFLAAAAACDRSPLWTRDGDWVVTRGRALGPGGGEAEEAFSERVLLATARYLPFLFDALPVGDPLRARIPDLLRLARERLAHPGLLVVASTTYLDPAAPERAQLLDAVGREPFPRGADPSAGRDGGVLVARVEDWCITIAFRPARLGASAAEAPPLLASSEAFEAVRALRSEGFAALAARVTSTPVPAGGFEANPLLSLPSLVAEVADTHHVGEDAATLYLQTLAHRAPTAREVQAWNGWTAGRYRKAAAELEAKGLVMVAKRARAGREHFLPGGWEDLKAPDLPIETWKLPLFGAKRVGSDVRRPLGVLLPLGPLHALYQAAWNRVAAGETPGYEEVP